MNSDLLQSNSNLIKVNFYLIEMNYSLIQVKSLFNLVLNNCISKLIGTPQLI